MLAAAAVALLIVGASALAGHALMRLLGESRPSPLAAAIGFAALVVACPLLIRLPGRAATTAVILAATLLAASIHLWRSRASAQSPGEGAEGATRGPGLTGRKPRVTPSGPISALVVVLMLAIASLPFLFNERAGVLGEGIYTNDQAAQLYWTDWLQNGFGPEPSAVQFGYPTGPQALTAAAAEATGAELDDAFNGLLLAIPILTALAALAALADTPPLRRVVVALLVGLPYLAASFLAQSAFKETAMALLVLAFAVCLSMLARGAAGRPLVGALLLLPVAAVFTYSVPALVWFALALPAWLALEALFSRRPLPWREVRDVIGRHRLAVGIAAIVLLVVVALSAGQISSFIEKIGDVQASAGRLSSPVWPGEALGIWPEGDFRIVRGEVSGAYPATLLGLVAVAVGALIALRRRDTALLATLAAAAVVYIGARLFGSIYVEAKALAVMAPLVMLVALRGLLSAPPAPTPSSERRPPRRGPALASLALGVGVALAAGASTLLALRAAPVGFDDRATALEALRGRVDGRTVAFLGVDRFAGYWLRGTLIESPGGYVPPEIRARPEKIWQQGRAMDLDTLEPNKLDRFDFAITTAAAFASGPPPNLAPIAREGDYVLWRRSGPTPPQRVLAEDGDPGRALDCRGEGGREALSDGGLATVLDDPVTGRPGRWSLTSPFTAPATAVQRLPLAPGRWRLSLQYHSQVPLRVEAGEREVTLPPSLDGMYLTHQGEGAFWPAGELRVGAVGPRPQVRVTAAEPSGLQRALGVERRVWLGELAASPAAPARARPLRDACGDYVDHYVPSRGGGGAHG